MSDKVTDISKAPAARARIVDELGRLDAKYRGWKQDLDRLKVLKDTVQGWASEILPENCTVYFGKRYEAPVSACEFKRQIVNMAGVVEAVGNELFIQHATFALGKLDVFVPNAEKLGLVTKDRSGPRKVTVRLKERAAPKAA